MFAVGPAGPTVGSASGGFEDGPGIGAAFPYAPGPEASDGDAESPGEPRFRRVVEAVGEQGEMEDGSWEIGVRRWEIGVRRTERSLVSFLLSVD